MHKLTIAAAAGLIALAGAPRRRNGRRARSPWWSRSRPAAASTSAPASRRSAWASCSGRPIVVENVGAAAGTVGSQRVAKAAPDGYTMLIGNSGTHAYSQSLCKRRPTTRSPSSSRSAWSRTRRASCWRARTCRSTTCRSSSPMPKPTRTRCSSARPASAPARICPACCSTSARAQHHPRALSRRRAGDAGPDRRPHRLLVRHHPDRRAAGQAGTVKGIAVMAPKRVPIIAELATTGEQGVPASRPRSGTRSSCRRERPTRSCASSTRR